MGKAVELHEVDADPGQNGVIKIMVGIKNSTPVEPSRTRADTPPYSPYDQEVRETAKFPKILYEASSIPVAKMSDMHYSATLNGSLRLHGITRSQPVAARVSLQGSMLRASGDFTPDQTDYA